MTCVLSLDFGTGGVRAGIFDVRTRRQRALAERPYPTRHIPPDRAEQNPDHWWAAAALAVRAAAASAGDPVIDAICAAATSSTVVFARRDGTALAPAILWMDARAWREAEFTGAVAHPLVAMSGGSDAVEWLVPKAMWAARHEPDLWARTDVCCEALDWLNFKLTGIWAGSQMIATCKWNYDARALSFSPGLFAALGVPDLPQKLPHAIVGIGLPVGRITREAARHLGIRGEPMVVQGGIDAHMGTFGAATLDPGDMLFIGGTSNVLLLQASDEEVPVEGVWGPYPYALVSGSRLVETGQVSAGSVLTWLTDTIFGLTGNQLPSLWEAAAQLRIDESRLLALDYFMGNRTPYRDARLRGAFIGLSLSHDRASLYRAAVTSVALGSANIVADLQLQGQTVKRLVIAGGIVRNPLWLEATIDAMGQPVEIAEVENLTLHGCAVACAFGLGLFPDLQSAARDLRAPTTQRLPDIARNAQYTRLLGDYRDATDALRPIMHRLLDTRRSDS